MAAYTTIDDPSAHFQTETYTGAGANTTVTFSGNSDLKPDLLWIKNRGAGYAHFVVDSNRNISYAQNSSNAPYLETDSTAAENNNQNWMQSVNTDGFTTGISEHINSTASSTFVAWAWKANGGTTSSNGDGGITSTVQANTTAGFSIVTYTGNSNNPSSIGHGLGVVPKFYVIKQRDAANPWKVYHSGIATDAEDYVMELNTTGAREDNAIWNDTGPTSSVINFTDHGGVNQSGETYVAYCFAEKQGYSKFGGYTGNGNSNGPFVYCGFKPAFVMIKRTDDIGGWTIYDDKRGHNGNNYELFPNSAEAEYTGTSYFEADILSNGFKLRLTDGQINASSGTYIYAAFAHHPFVTSTGIPTTAR